MVVGLPPRPKHIKFDTGETQSSSSSSNNNARDNNNGQDKGYKQNYQDKYKKQDGYHWSYQNGLGPMDQPIWP